MEGTKEAEQREDDQFLRWPLSSNSERKPRLLPHLDPSTFISLKEVLDKEVIVVLFLRIEWDSCLLEVTAAVSGGSAVRSTRTQSFGWRQPTSCQCV
ncbi:hypothetical protein LSTR_LSTR008491 [Laodelphax striatellus]|uniref:Uncharacterized protein n=1 Tax=Laodelphax striatellus TaxID=195883 RepID=A0A482WRX0_LAOST|nr:hypothetical protein LSTR_LSTR008491 [Laodelphax striatellus]